MKKKIDKHYEFLTKLYLRLKGFIVSNLIIHSEQQGNSKSELDIIGIRMPFHLQNDRQVNVPDYLECSNQEIEIIIGDVKNYKKLDKVKFNEGLRKDCDSIKKLIEWLGCFETVTPELITKFEVYLNLHRKPDWNGFAQFSETSSIGKFNFKFTFFCPKLSKWNGNGFKYIAGEEMINFIWECLNDKQIINSCSRRYAFEGWNELKDYVRFFKDATNKVTLGDFEQYFKT